nr:TPA_asm: coat protein [Silene ophiovirus]
MSSPKVKVADLIDYSFKFSAKNASASMAKVLADFNMLKDSDTIDDNKVTVLAGLDSNLEIDAEDLGKEFTAKGIRPADQVPPSEENKLGFSSMRDFPSGHSEVINTIESFSQMVNIESISISPEKLISVLNDFAPQCKIEAGYVPKEVKVATFVGAEVKMEFLIAAGTCVLDAALYEAFHNDEKINDIFEVVTVESIPKNEIQDNLIIGKSGFCAAICMVYNRGGLPTIESKKPLQKFVLENFSFRELKIDTESDLAKLLSRSNLRKFPGEALLKMKLESLPAEVGGRCKLSIAGNKFVRLACLAAGHSKEKLRDITKMKPEEMVKGIEYNLILAKSKEISDCLVEQAANIEGQLNLHPLNKKRHVPPGFVLSAIKAIMFQLDSKGRENLVDIIITKKLGVFAQDANIVGTINAVGVRQWPILDNKEVDFMKYSKEAVLDIFKKKN